MARLAKVVLVDRNFYNFFECDELFINVDKTKKVIGVVNQILGTATTKTSRVLLVVDSMPTTFLYLNFLDCLVNRPCSVVRDPTLVDLFLVKSW
jgi:hypothetical protein